MRLLAEAPEATSAAQVVPDAVVGDYTDAATLSAFAAASTRSPSTTSTSPPATCCARSRTPGPPSAPGPDALVYAQDKAVMRDRLTALGVPVPGLAGRPHAEDLVAFGDEIGWPVIAKTSRGGYDGKGVWKVDGPDGRRRAPFAALGGALGPTERRRPRRTRRSAPDDVVIVAEEFVPFTRELSVLVVRRPGGESVTYPVSETVQRDGICHETTTPAPGLDAARAAARSRRFATRIADELGVVGVLAVELMERPDGEVVVNELAMRPAQHRPLEPSRARSPASSRTTCAPSPTCRWGSTALTAPVVVMSNVLGGDNPDLVGSLATVLADPDVRVHLYGKSVKPGRKVGHVTVCGTDVAATQAAARAASDYLEGE